VQGRHIGAPIEGQRAAGAHEERWGGAGHNPAPGLYFVRLEAGGRALSGRVTMVR
jgi:hypothetical protein